ncbi:MAG: hypothetical protein N2Z63_08385 [Thiobacillaceae bacterium]|nr:hypothetical protein [Thiobacillaceae bacterium]
MRAIVFLLSVCLMAGCGAEVGTAAATAAQVKAQEARAAERLEQEVAERYRQQMEAVHLRPLDTAESEGGPAPSPRP